MPNRIRDIFACVSTLVSLSALAETTLCNEITSIPFVISTPGVYCLKTELTSSDPSPTYAAITVSANNVAIDFNGHRLGGLGAGTATQAAGIYALDRQNITIRNGTIRGYHNGIWLDTATLGGSRGHLIEDMHLDQNTSAAITGAGDDMEIRHNLITSTGGSTLNGGPNAAWGIDVQGNNVSIVGNKISGTHAYGAEYVYTIELANADGALIADNLVVGSSFGSNSSTGIYLYIGGVTGGSGVVRNNSVLVTTPQGLTSNGLSLTAGTGGTIVFRDNTVRGFTTNYPATDATIVDGGGNH